MFCITASPLLISGSVATMSTTDHATYTNSEAVAISQDALGEQGVRLAGGALVNAAGNPVGVTNVWGRPLTNGRLALAFINTGPTTVNLSCTAACLQPHFAIGARVTIRDVWENRTSVMTMTDAGIEMTGVLGSGGSALIVLTPMPPTAARHSPPSPPALCSLNGKVGPGGNCTCRAGWHGGDCQYLNLGPIDLSTPQGYGRAPNVTAWGASLLVDQLVQPPVFHLFATEEMEGCGMASWKSNSQIIHAVSSTAVGPFRRVGVTIPFATNPSVHYDHAAQVYRMLILPTGTAGKQHKCGGAPRFQNDETVPEVRGGSNQLYSTPSLDANWTRTAAEFPPCNNPSGAVDTAGVAWLLCHGGTKGYVVWWVWMPGR
jgi:hypothetical protein